MLANEPLGCVVAAIEAIRLYLTDHSLIFHLARVKFAIATVVFYCFTSKHRLTGRQKVKHMA